MIRSEPDLPMFQVFVGCLTPQTPLSAWLLPLSLISGLRHSRKLLLCWLPLPRQVTKSLPSPSHRLGMTFSGVSQEAQRVAAVLAASLASGRGSPLLSLGEAQPSPAQPSPARWL